MSRKNTAYVAEFIRDVHKDVEPEMSEHRSGVMMSRAGEGSIFLSQQEAASYTTTVGQLLKGFARDGDLSRRSVERHLQEALFSALDIRRQRQESFDDRLADALKELTARLSGPTVSYRCFLPVNGLSPENLPLTFGTVRFVKFGSSHQRQLLSPVAGDSKSRQFRRMIHDLRQDKLWGNPCAVAHVQARDFDTAAVRARGAVRAAVDCVNFFDDLIPYNYGWLYLPAEAARALETAPIISSEGQVLLPHSVVGPIAAFSLENLQKFPRVRRQWNAVSALARARAPKGGAEVLLTSIKWAGRASVEPKKEQSFLLFAIALESAVLPDISQELNYRLSLRVSRLLGRGRGEREEIRGLVVRLYKVRSDIVHSGSYEVTEEDLGRIRWLTKTVLLRLLRKRSLWLMSRAELGEWLEGLIAK